MLGAPRKGLAGGSHRGGVSAGDKGWGRVPTGGGVDRSGSAAVSPGGEDVNCLPRGQREVKGDFSSVKEGREVNSGLYQYRDRDSRT